MERPVDRPLSVLLAATVLLAAPTVAADWPGLLGPERNGVAAEETAIGWEGETPPELWSLPVGSGWSGPSVADGRVFVFHRRGEEVLLEARDRATGDALWSSSQPTSYEDDFGFDAGPRATPEVADGRVVTYGAAGRLTSRRVEDGEILWTVDTRAIYGPEKLFFGVGATPLLIEGLVVTPVGSTDGAGIVAFDAETGAERWRATDHEVSYSSPIRAKVGRQQRIVAWTREGVVDLDPEDGRLRSFRQFESRLGSSVQAATPIVVGRNRLLVTASYGLGAGLMELGRGAVELRWSTDYALSSHFATPVPVDERHVVGFHGRQEAGAELRCLRLERGEVCWTFEGTGAGSVLRVDEQLVVLTEKGELLVAPFEKDAFRPRHRVRILEPTVRALPAFSDGVLFARDPERLVAFDLRAGTKDR